MQLTAHSLGLASIWRTGPVAYHQNMRRFFSLEEGDRIVAYLYLGYPDMGERPRRRSPAGERTVWHGRGLEWGVGLSTAGSGVFEARLLPATISYDKECRNRRAASTYYSLVNEARRNVKTLLRRALIVAAPIVWRKIRNRRRER